ncbi:MAG: hypothetical protein ACJ71I_09140, partial [Nitrososphaeraceae archaeon]
CKISIAIIMPPWMEMVACQTGIKPPFSASATKLSKSCIEYCSWDAQYPKTLFLLLLITF